MTYTLVQGNPLDDALSQQLHRYGAVNPQILDRRSNFETPHVEYRVVAEAWAEPPVTDADGVCTFRVIAAALGTPSVAVVVS
jgi:hypothetical protein